MKTLTKTLLAAVLGGALILTVFALPPSKSIPTFHSNSFINVPAQPDISGLKCAHMMVPNFGVTKQAGFTIITCTPEMMKNDWRCRQACGM